MCSSHHSLMKLPFIDNIILMICTTHQNADNSLPLGDYPNCYFYNSNMTSKVQGTSRKRGQKECKNIRGRAREMLSPGHDMATVLMDSLQLWSPAYDQANKIRQQFQQTV